MQFAGRLIFLSGVLLIIAVGFAHSLSLGSSKRHRISRHVREPAKPQPPEKRPDEP